MLQLLLGAIIKFPTQGTKMPTLPPVLIFVGVKKLVLISVTAALILELLTISNLLPSGVMDIPVGRAPLNETVRVDLLVAVLTTSRVLSLLLTTYKLAPSELKTIPAGYLPTRILSTNLLVVKLITET